MALDRLADEVPDIILLDLMMPEMDGFQLITALQERPAWRRIPVIVITSLDLTAADRARLNSGVERILLKDSFDPAQLVAIVRGVRCEDSPIAEDAGGSLVTKILYVEDNDDNIYMLKMRFELLDGFEVLVAEDGEIGCEKAAAEMPDIILMDLDLPVVDGWEATRRLKSDRKTRHIPIIALTAHAMSGSREKALAAGCDEFDTKPVDFDRLMQKVGQLLAKKRT